MFNAEQKTKYINKVIKSSSSEDIEKYERYYINYFNRLEKYESKLNKDAAMMNSQELKELLEDFLSGSFDYQRTDKSLLQNYIDWAISKDLSLDNENRLIGMSIHELNIKNKMSNKLLKDEDDLFDYLDVIFVNPTESNNDIMLRCFYVLLYMGFSQDECFMLTKDNVNFNKHIVTYVNKTIPMDKRCEKVIRDALEIESIFKINGKSGYDQIIERTNEYYVLENTKSLASKMDNNYRDKMQKSFISACGKKTKGMDRVVSLNNVLVSGIFNRMLEKENVTKEIDTYEYLEFKQGKLVDTFSINDTEKECVKLYIDWKKAFNL